MKTIILFSLIAVCSLQAQAQETFQKTIGGTANDYANSIAQTADGGFVLIGDTYSFVLSKSDIYIVKFDSHGNLLWNKTFGGTNYEHGTCIAATSDGGCIAGGISGDNNNSIVLLKIDAAGSLEWSKFYSAKVRHTVSSVVPTPEGGYVLGGSASTYDNGSWGYVIKTDDKGNLQWSKLLFDRSFYPNVQRLVVTKDSGYAAIANETTTNAYYDIFLIKLDKNGDFKWSKSIGNESTDYPVDLIETSDGGLAFTGITFDLNSSPQYSFMCVLKTDSIGNFIFAKRIKGTNTDISKAIAETNDKQLIISGSIPSPAGTQKNVFVTKLDTLGKILWTKILADDVTSSEAADLINTADSGYALAGRKGNLDAQDFLLVKFDTAVNTCGAVADIRDDSDFGQPVKQKVKVTNVITNVSNTSYTLKDAAGVANNVCDVLAVNKLLFTAAEKNENVLLEWSLMDETNVKSFELYRSTDSRNYKLLTTVIAHTTQNAGTNYSYTDAAANAGKNFYKIKITDKDGGYYFSEIRTVEINRSFAKIFPNPVKDWLHVQLANTAGSINLKIFSADGRLVFDKTITSINAYELIDVRKLAAGTYSLNIIAGNSRSNQIFIKN